jgi:peptidoglycan hydrolase CwlO-like protein
MFRQNKFFISCLALAIFMAGGFLFAETVDTDKIDDVRLQLEAELAELEAQIAQEMEVIKEKQRQATTLERDIAILDAQISKSKLQIRARNITINNLISEIDKRSDLIVDLEQRMDWQRVSLAELLRRLNEMDSTSLVEIILGYESLSDFFADFNSFESIQKELQVSFNEIKSTQIVTENERQELLEKKSEELELRYIQELERKRLEQAEDEKAYLLRITKGEEARYQKILDERQKDAASIRSQLFLLRGSPDIPFEKAVEYANLVFQETGVRPAFLLGVIAEESNLGANVGTGNWKEDLSHYRCKKQREAFVKITSELGLDPDAMPVSRRAWYGYCGGAMGPAQFMPTTWLLYKDLIAARTGHNPPNPWDPIDAFMGAGLLLRDNGAAAGGYTAERRAALRYLAGGNWSKPAYAFYGDDVMALAAKYQKQIDIINGN